MVANCSFHRGRMHNVFQKSICEVAPTCRKVLHRRINNFSFNGVLFVIELSSTRSGAIPWIFSRYLVVHNNGSLLVCAKKEFQLHKEFMIRSYVCSLAFVFIRILPSVNEYTGLFNFIENDEMKWSIYEWICWVYPLLITEFLLSWWPAIIKLRTADKK